MEYKILLVFRTCVSFKRKTLWSFERPPWTKALGKFWCQSDFISKRNCGLNFEHIFRYSPKRDVARLSSKFVRGLRLWKSFQVILAGTLTGVQGDIRCKVLAALFTCSGTGLIEGCNRRKCFYCLFIEMECILLRFPTYVIGPSLAEIVKIENTRISS